MDVHKVPRRRPIGEGLPKKVGGRRSPGDGPRRKSLDEGSVEGGLPTKARGLPGPGGRKSSGEADMRRPPGEDTG